MTKNDDIFPGKQPTLALLCSFQNSICNNVTLRSVLLFSQKWPQTIETKKEKAQQKLFSVEWRQWQEVLAVTERVPGGSHRATHSPRAAGSHFLPGTQPKWPIVTPEGLGKEVTTGYSTVLETKWSDYALGPHQQWLCSSIICYSLHVALSDKGNTGKLYLNKNIQFCFSNRMETSQFSGTLRYNCSCAHWQICRQCLCSMWVGKYTSSVPAEWDGAPQRTWPAASVDRVSHYPSAGRCDSSDSATGSLLYRL